MLHTITNWVRKIGSRKPRHASKGLRQRQRKAGRRFSAFRPYLECLEDRIAPAVGVDITNLGLAVDPNSVQMDGNLVAFDVNEAAQGTDLNGDGDTTDQVLEVYDASTGTTTNLGLAGFGIQVAGNLVAFDVSEGAQGNTDLNGDGDTNDGVMFVYDASTGTTTNLGLANSYGAEVSGNLVAFPVTESAQGTDLNGDGDLSDEVLEVYDSSTGTITNLGLAVGITAQPPPATNEYKLDGNLLAFEVSESAQGGTDLNGDGDGNDWVQFVYDASTRTTTNLGLAVGPYISSQVDGNLVAFEVNESAQGGTDLNGNGVAGSNVMFVYDASTGTTTNLGLATYDFKLNGNLLAFVVEEGAQGGTDLNGDGDATDPVMFVYDASTGTTTNLGLAAIGSFTLKGNLLAFDVSEYWQGGTDLNGNGVVGDTPTYVYDASTGTTTNLGLSGFGIQVAGNLVAFGVYEVGQGTDLNGDGDTNDEVMYVYDASTGTTTNLGLAVDPHLDPDISSQLNGNLLAFPVSESNQGGTDLNGDGDARDNVLYVYDPADGTTTNIGIDSTWGFQLDGTRIAVPVNESQVGTDLNGDGDSNDEVMFVVKISIDTDGDGIADDVDTQPAVFSNDFSDGTTTGTITNRGDQQLTIVDAHNPADGVLVTAAASGGPTPATISVKGGTATYTINAGDQLVITDGNVITNVIAGAVPITFRGNDGSIFTTTLDGGTADDGVDQGLTFDPATDLFTTPATNTSTVEVFDSNGNELTVAPGGIAGPTLQQVGIDIKPGSDPNSINLGSGGTVAVAIFSSATFDATTVDPNTVTLANAAVRLKGNGTPMSSEKDVNGDGLLDLIVHVSTDALQLTDGDVSARLLGQTYSGVPIVGTDSVRVVDPTKPAAIVGTFNPSGGNGTATLPVVPLPSGNNSAPSAGTTTAPSPVDPVGSLSLFGIGLGPKGIDLFEIDSQGDVFAQDLFGGGLQLIAPSLHLSEALMADDALLALLAAENGQQYFLDVVNPLLPQVEEAVLTALQ